jgi:hypothetical protein
MMSLSSLGSSLTPKNLGALERPGLETGPVDFDILVWRVGSAYFEGLRPLSLVLGFSET